MIGFVLGSIIALQAIVSGKYIGMYTGSGAFAVLTVVKSNGNYSATLEKYFIEQYKVREQRVPGVHFSFENGVVHLRMGSIQCSGPASCSEENSVILKLVCRTKAMDVPSFFKEASPAQVRLEIEKLHDFAEHMPR